MYGLPPAPFKSRNFTTSNNLFENNNIEMPASVLFFIDFAIYL